MRSATMFAIIAVVCCSLAAYAGDRPAGQLALFAAQEKAKGAPLDEVVRIYQEDVIAAFPGSLYAGQALLNIGSAYMEHKQPKRALELTEQALREYGHTYLASQAVRRKFAITLYSLHKPQEALDFLDEAMPQYAKQLPSRDLHWFAAYRYDAHKALGSKEQALKALEDAIITTPQVLDSWEFFRRYIPALQAAGKRQEAQSAAKGAYACCKFSDTEVKRVADLVVKSFVSVAAVFKANQFVACQEDAEKDNPLKDVPWPKIEAPEKWKQLMVNCRKDLHLQIVALLYYGDYEQAVGFAMVRLGEAKDTNVISACVDDIARCFKAKDLNLVRANQFIEYAKEGKGENPLIDF